jgi:hypothetical protein
MERFTDVFKWVEVADGRIWMRPEGVVCFAGDLAEEEQKVVWATHYAPAADLFSRNAPALRGSRSRLGTLWPKRPHGAAGSATLSGEAYGCNHPHCRQPRPDAVPPGLVIDVIRAAAKAVQGSSATA